MKQQADPIKAIISGGGTGGHIFPAISIADEIIRRFPNAEILFVGALGRMEMERVPAAGYKIIGLPVSGFQRKLTLKNIKVVVNLLRSIIKAKKIIKNFKPQIAIGVGGYASGPLLRSAARRGIPTLLQEQNSYAGVTNKLLAKKAGKICVAYKGMDKYFSAEKIVLTGNPVRNLTLSDKLREEGIKHFKLNNKLPVLLVIGGSLGARTINESILGGLEEILKHDIQLIWQTGKFYFEEMEERLPANNERLKMHAFLTRMDLAYNVADLVVSRAGAISISELCLLGKPSILVPSPNVAEDHQTKNALALVEENAAMMIKDKDIAKQLTPKAIELLNNKKRSIELAANIKQLAKPEATQHIVDEVLKLIEEN